MDFSPKWVNGTGSVIVSSDPPSPVPLPPALPLFGSGLLARFRRFDLAFDNFRRASD